MQKYRHTINLSAVPILTVFDDQGEVVQAVMLPICLIIFLPARLWAAWQKITSYASHFPLPAFRSPFPIPRSPLPASRFLAAAYQLFLGPGWREDLRFMSLAIFSPPSGRGWGRAAL